MLNSKTPLLACVLTALLGMGATPGLQNDESANNGCKMMGPILMHTLTDTQALKGGTIVYQ